MKSTNLSVLTRVYDTFPAGPDLIQKFYTAQTHLLPFGNKKGSYLCANVCTLPQTNSTYHQTGRGGSHTSSAESVYSLVSSCWDLLKKTHLESKELMSSL